MSNDQSPNPHQQPQTRNSSRASTEPSADTDKMVSQHPAPPPFNPIVPTSETTPSPDADSTQTVFPALSTGSTVASSSSTTNLVRNKDPATPQPSTTSSAPPTSLNPHMSHAHDSVVPDLMRVYESMTGASASLEVPPEQQSYLNQQQQQDSGGVGSGGYYPPWTYETSNIPIPPIPENSFAAMAAASAAATATSSSSQPQQDEIASNASTTSRTSRNSRSLRKRHSASINMDNTADTTSSSKSRRKNTKQDGRWSKRFTWPEDLHRDFVSAVFDVGLKNSSPSSILEQMPPHEQVTTERIKSHLQKYRLHRAKSKKEFLSSYNATLAKMQKEGITTTKSLAGGEVAGHLAYVTLSGHEVPEEAAVEDNPEMAAAAKVESNADAVAATAQASSSQGQQEQQQQHHHQQQQQDCLIFPRLTEEEKRSPIGTSMGHLMGLFFTLKQQLELEREAKKSKSASVVSNVYQSFVHGHAPDSFDSTGTATAAAAVAVTGGGGRATKTAGPSTRSNLEENTLMKREMQIQMAFQNKMRALKQQEVAKYKADQQQYSSTEHDMEMTPHVHYHPRHHHHHHQNASGKQAPPEDMQQQQQQQQQQQGAGEQQETDGRSVDMNDDGQSQQQQQQQQQQQGQRTMSIGNADDFWNTDVVDDQLFEFLMNN